VPASRGLIAREAEPGRSLRSEPGAEAFRQPFDLSTDAASIPRNEKAAGTFSGGLLQAKLPWLDTFRTLLLAPPPDVRDILLAIKDFGLVA
jgi:hypothetical protein